MKTVISPLRFTKDMSSPDAIRSRRYIDSTTGASISRRQAIQLSTGMTVEARVAASKAAAPPTPTPAAPTRLPRTLHLKNTNGTLSAYKQFKVANLKEVATYARLLPKDTIMTVKALGKARKASPKKRTRTLKSGKTVTYVVQVTPSYYSTVSNSLFRADEAHLHLMEMSQKINERFVSVDQLYVVFRPGR